MSKEKLGDFIRSRFASSRQPRRYNKLSMTHTPTVDQPFKEKMQRLVAQLRDQQAEAAQLDAAIAANLKGLGYGG